MSDRETERSGGTGPVVSGAVREMLDVLRGHLASVEVEASSAEQDTVLRLRFSGSEKDLKARQILVRSLEQYLPASLSLIGVRPGRDGGAREVHRDSSG